MNSENADTMNAESILENLTRTLLYEGYALFPYYRSAIKNQKPIPFGVVFPQQYNIYNEHAHSNMQTQCIVTGNNPSLNITVRFLHLKKIELFQNNNTAEESFIAVDNVNIENKFYQAGWQTIEHKINADELQITELIKEKKIIPFAFEKMKEDEFIYDENNVAAAKQINVISEITGAVTTEATSIENIENAFRITVSITNTTSVANIEMVTRDEVLCQSFLSTHTILNAVNGTFISLQDPGEKWKAITEQCNNKGIYPILIDAGDTTMLSSPIALYDYPQINPQSMGDLFDSTEIEEALLLHVGLLSDEEKKRIAQTDEKLHAMLSKVSQVTPEELINFHGVLKNTVNND